MGHHASRSVYDRLTERLNRFPQGAPPAESLFRILKILFGEREAALVSLLPIRPFTAKQAAAIWKVGEAEARTTLDVLAGRALLVDWEGERGTEYVLPPPMAGFFEFSLMRVRTDIDQKALAELFHQYLNVEEEFVRALFAEGETQLGRAFVQEAVALAGERAPRPRFRAGQRGDPDRHPPRDLPLLLPPQDGARGEGLRRAPGHLHDLQRLGLVAHPARPRPRGRGGRGDGDAPPGTGAGSRAVRRERSRGRELHLQLLRLLLRGHDRVAPVRGRPPRPHHPFPPVGRRGRLHRLRALRAPVPRRGARGGLRQRPEAPEAHRGPARRGPLPGLRRLRPRLPGGGAHARRAWTADAHAGERGPPGGAHGARARKAPGPRSSTTGCSGATVRWPRSSGPS